MKNHIVFKFIAVILCAASLMGAVGSILGVVAMAEGDLYNKTVDQVIDERVSDNCTHYATELALAYASLELGGCSEDMIRQQFENNWWFENSYPSYGYTILDAEGTTLAEYNTGLKDSATFYSVPVTGKYMYLVSVESQSELQAQREQALKASDLDCYFHPDFYEECYAEVYQMSATLADGSGVGYNGGNVPLGSITYYADHYVVFETTTARGYDNSMMTLPVTSIVFSDQDGSTVFSISCSDGVGDFAVTDSGSIVFTSVTFEEAMSAGSSRFVGQLTGADGEVVPPEGMSVSQVTFTDADGQVIYEAYCDYLNCDSTYYDTNGDCASYSNVSSQTGFLFYSQSGQLVYNSSLMEGEDPFTATVYGVDFYNDSQVLRCKLDDPDGLGTLTLKDGRLVFTSFLPAETTAAETVPETVPETEPETVPETVETVAEEAVGEAEDTPDDSSDETSAEEAAEETAAAETAAAEETVPSSASAVPEETSTVSEDPTAPEASAAPEAPTEPTAAETVPVTVPQETLPEVTEPVLIDGKTLDNYQINRVQYQDSETGETMTAKYVYVTMPELTVEMYVDRSTMQDAASYDVLRMVRAYRNYLMPAIGICLLLFAVFAVYLCTSAGRSAKSEEIKAGGLNRLPLDHCRRRAAGTAASASGLYGRLLHCRRRGVPGLSGLRGLLLRLCGPDQDPRRLLVAQFPVRPVHPLVHPLRPLAGNGAGNQGLPLPGPRLQERLEKRQKICGRRLPLPETHFHPLQPLDRRKVPGLLLPAAHDLAVAAGRLRHVPANRDRVQHLQRLPSDAVSGRLRRHCPLCRPLLRHPAGKHQAYGQRRPGHQGGRQAAEGFL